MREWRNRQTRTFEGRVGRLVRVQVPSLAPTEKKRFRFSLLFCLSANFPGLEVGAVVNDSPVDCQSRDRTARRRLAAELTGGLTLA